MLCSAFVAALCGSVAVLAQSSSESSADLRPGAHFIEQFDPTWSERWSVSEAMKEQKEGEVFAYNGKWVVDKPSVLPGTNKSGLIASSKAAQHAISVPFSSPIDPTGKTFVAQYEVKLQKGLECGGAYMKLLSESPDDIRAKEFSDKTPYTVMFGPDHCGTTNKVHFIVRHRNPVTGTIEEKHLKAPPAIKNTKTTVLYTLIVSPDQTYEIKIDDEVSKKGSLFEDFEPPFNPPKEIDDPSDRKPDDWVDEAKIPDPDATKPADWDEDAPAQIPDEDAEMPEGWLLDEEPMIPDPDAEKPEEWDDDEDGDFIPPMISNPVCEDAPGCGPWIRPMKANPAYKGKWSAPFIDNPAYKGPWAPRKIANPDYYEDPFPANLSPMAGLGFEIWTMQESILFDNIFIGDDEASAEDFAKETFHVKRAAEQLEEDKSQPSHDDPSGKGRKPVEFRKAPIDYLRKRLKSFLDVAMVDPMLAFKTQPETAAVVGGAAATLIGMLGVLLSLLSPKPKETKKSSESAAKKADTKGSSSSSSAATAAGTTSSSNADAAEIRKRTTRSQAAATE